MIEDKEIWACAGQLTRRYGDGAGLRAAQRADELLEANDIAGHRTWLRILRKIELLEQQVPQGPVH